MVILTSDSCNTLVSLENDDKTLLVNNDAHSHGPSIQAQEYKYTELRLPQDEFDLDNANDDRHLFLSTNSQPVDEFLKQIPSIRESCDELLANPPVHYTQESRERVLYVGQGEIAHTAPLQCDVILSDKATTCHVFAMRSVSDESFPITTLTHIDAPSYEQCIRDAVQYHKNHHRTSMVDGTCHAEEKKDDDAVIVPSEQRIEMDLHIVGGFNDDNESSREISTWLMNLLATIANEERLFIKMTLRTCAISALNDNGHSCPIGRGLGINVNTGRAFLAKADECVAGPALTLRSIRLWSRSDGESKLTIIHDTTSKDLRIQPFSYKPFAEINGLLNLPDDILLQYTSTSPEVEESDFCQSVRTTLCFLRDVHCSRVFGVNLDKEPVFRRVGSSNAWARIR